MLQGARSVTIAESNGRANILLAAVSGGLVALGLVAPASSLGASWPMRTGRPKYGSVASGARAFPTPQNAGRNVTRATSAVVVNARGLMRTAAATSSAARDESVSFGAPR